MTARRRRYLEQNRPRDRREIVVIEGHEISCERFKQCASVPVMSAVDQMPPEWRALIYEYGADAHELFDASVPVFANGKRITADEAHQALESQRRKVCAA